jgi:aromatic prenyltransferase Orf2
MSGSTKVAELYSAIEESARLVGATCSRDKVWPILTAFEEAFAEALIVFGVQTSGRHAGELDYSFTAPPGIGDPYLHALSNGLVAKTDHPAGSLLSDIQGRWAISEHFVDCEVADGFRKLYAHFPRDLQRVSKLAGIPSMPRAVADNADFFARHGLDDVTMIGIDYKRKAMNVYFQLPAGGSLEPKTILSMLREIGLPNPDERMLELACESQRIYTTLSWDSSKIQRISFAPPPRRGLDLSALPIRLDPKIEQFMRGAPRTYAGERISIAAVKWRSPDGECIDLGSFYQLSPQQLKAVAANRKVQR